MAKKKDFRIDPLIVEIGRVKRMALKMHRCAAAKALDEAEQKAGWEYAGIVTRAQELRTHKLGQREINGRSEQLGCNA